MNKVSDKNARSCGHFFASFIFLALFGANAHAESEFDLYAFADHFIYSEPISVATAYNDLIGDFTTGERAYFYRWYEAGVLVSDFWGLGFVSRRDYSLNFSEDAAELIGAIANGETLQPGREYDLDLEAYGFDAEGVRVFLRPDIKSWLGLEFGLSFLRADYLIAGSASGTAQALSVDEYEYSLSVDYNYAEDILFEREVSGVTGLGASLDVSVEVQIDSWEFNLQIRDLLGALYWQDVPNTVAEAYSDRVEINEAGYAEWSPAVSGVESNKDFTLWLQPRLNSSLIYNYGRARFGLGTHYWVEDWLPRIGFGYEFTHLDAYSWYWLESSLVEVSLIWPKIAVNAGLDSLTHDEVKALYIGASLNY